MTVLKWYYALPTQIRIAAINNCNAHELDENCSSLRSAIGLFQWSNTVQGDDYWRNIRDAVEKITEQNTVQDVADAIAHAGIDVDNVKTSEKITPKLRIDFINELPPKIAQQVLDNYNREARAKDKSCGSMCSMLERFSWGDSPEGEEYWTTIYHRAANGQAISETGIYIAPIKKPWK